jgi:hypothetical protein
VSPKFGPKVNYRCGTRAERFTVPIPPNCLAPETKFGGDGLWSGGRLLFPSRGLYSSPWWHIRFFSSSLSITLSLLLCQFLCKTFEFSDTHYFHCNLQMSSSDEGHEGPPWIRTNLNEINQVVGLLTCYILVHPITHGLFFLLKLEGQTYFLLITAESAFCTSKFTFFPSMAIVHSYWTKQQSVKVIYQEPTSQHPIHFSPMPDVLENALG